jgi:hypothetical protein
MTKTIDQMPLFPDEATIALAVLGPKRAKDWPHIAKFLEDKHAFPRVDKLMGGRYWPAVIAHFTATYNMEMVEAGANRRGSNIRVVPFPADSY